MDVQEIKTKISQLQGVRPPRGECKSFEFCQAWAPCGTTGTACASDQTLWDADVAWEILQEEFKETSAPNPYEYGGGETSLIHSDTFCDVFQGAVKGEELASQIRAVRRIQVWWRHKRDAKLGHEGACSDHLGSSVALARASTSPAASVAANTNSPPLEIGAQDYRTREGEDMQGFVDRIAGKLVKDGIEAYLEENGLGLAKLQARCQELELQLREAGLRHEIAETQASAAGERAKQALKERNEFEAMLEEQSFCLRCSCALKELDRVGASHDNEDDLTDTELSFGGGDGHDGVECALHTGAAVRLHGLQSQKELNGHVGTLLEFDRSKLRWGVALPDGRRIALKEGNLQTAQIEKCETTSSCKSLQPPPLQDQALFRSLFGEDACGDC